MSRLFGKRLIFDTLLAGFILALFFGFTPLFQLGLTFEPSFFLGV
jgi:hypothetical protein